MACLPAQGFLPLHCVHTSTGVERGESKWGLTAANPELASSARPPCPARAMLSGALQEAHLPGVHSGLVTPEAQEATDPLCHSPTPRLLIMQATERLCSSFHPSSRGLCWRKTRLLGSLRKHHFPKMVAKLLPIQELVNRVGTSTVLPMGGVVTSGENRKWKQVVLRDNGMRWKREGDLVNPRREWILQGVSVRFSQTFMLPLNQVTLVRGLASLG